MTLGRRQDRRRTTGSLVGAPTRSCLTCRRRAAKPSLTRLAAVGGTVTIDPSASVPGRGAYVCQRESCLDAALDKGAVRILRALRLGSGHKVDDEAIRAAWNKHRGGAPSSAGAATTGTPNAQE